MTWDVVVVGAGPAGSVAAREVARCGAKVLLVDKSKFPRTKVCGCCLNGSALAALQSIGLGNVPSECGAVPLRAMKLAAGGTSADLRLPAGVALSRDAFDAALIREAEESGATFAPGTLVKWDGDRLTLPDGGSLAAKIVILATGLAGTNAPQQFSSPTRKQGIASSLACASGSTNDSHDLTSPTRKQGTASSLACASGSTINSRLGAGVVVNDAPDFFEPGTIYMATGRGGYVGLVRLEDDRLDIAAAFDAAFVRSSGGLGPAAEAILARTGWPKIEHLAESPWKGTPALTRRPAMVAAHRFFAVGDAAGYVEPFTGEGMAWAISSAAALAPIAHRAAIAWDDRFIAEWQRTHARIVSRRQGICRIASRVLRSPRLTGLAVHALSALPWLARPVVTLLNRPAHRPGFTS